MGNDIIELFALGGFWGGPAVIILGKLFIGRRDKRTKTGWRNNRKPRWLPGIICYLLGACWFATSVIQSFS